MGLAARLGEGVIDDPRQKAPPGQGWQAKGRRARNRASITSNSSLNITGTHTFLQTFGLKDFRRFEPV